MNRKLLWITTISILLLTAWLPSAYSEATVTNAKKVPVIVKIFDVDKIYESKKEIDVEKAEKIFSLREEKAQAIAKELNKLDLLSGLSIERVVSLLNGDYQKRHAVISQNNRLFNLLCSINFTATGCMMIPVFPFGCMFHMLGIVNYLLSLGIPPLFLFPFYIPLFLLYTLFIPIDITFKFIGLYFPVKPTLFRGFLIGNGLHLKTKGLLGIIETHANHTTIFRIRGFTGIWITNPISHYSWGRGFAISIYQWQ